MKISWGVRPPWSLHWRDIRWRYLDGREYVANIQNLEVDKSYIQYSSKSAYAIQFAGSYCTFNSTAIWKAKTEGKHRFFGWLFLQQKIQTADNLTLKGIPCDPQCCLLWSTTWIGSTPLFAVPFCSGGLVFGSRLDGGSYCCAIIRCSCWGLVEWGSFAGFDAQ